MGADEFCALLAELFDDPHPAVSWWSTFQDAGFRHSRYGILMRTSSGGHLAAQVMAVGALRPDGEGDPPPPLPRPYANPAPPTLVQDVEAWLAWRLVSLRDRRLRRVTRFSESDHLGDYRTQCGLEVLFHGGSEDWRVLVVFPFLLRSGERPERNTFLRAVASV